MNRQFASFFMGFCVALGLFFSMGAQVNFDPKAIAYSAACQVITAEISLYEFDALKADAATQAKRLAKIKQYAADMDAYAP